MTDAFTSCYDRRKPLPMRLPLHPKRDPPGAGTHRGRRRQYRVIFMVLSHAKDTGICQRHRGVSTFLQKPVENTDMLIHSKRHHERPFCSRLNSASWALGKRAADASPPRAPACKREAACPVSSGLVSTMTCIASEALEAIGLRTEVRNAGLNDPERVFISPARSGCRVLSGGTSSTRRNPSSTRSLSLRPRSAASALA